MTSNATNRRKFLKSVGVAGTALAVPTIVSPRVFGKSSPSNTLNLGCIGTGRQGLADIKEARERGLSSATSARIVAVCDVDRNRAEHAKTDCDRFYAERLANSTKPDIMVFDDFRELLSRDDIDGVTISTPDHWHALIAIAAADAKKDIYVQKPVTYTVQEGKRLVEAVRRNSVVLQTGSQQRSSSQFRIGCELVRKGRIGKLQTITVRVPKDKGTATCSVKKPPSTLNYEMWLGPTSMKPYCESGVHPESGYSRPGWLQIEQYCRGMITGWGSHMFDIAQWGHGSDDSGPVSMEAKGEFPDRGLFDVHMSFSASARYSDGVQLIAETGPAGVTFEGEDGWVTVKRWDVQAHDPQLIEEYEKERNDAWPANTGHMSNFLECMRTRKDPVCPVEVGHRSNTICVITHIAMKLGRPLRWDPQVEQFVDDSEANSMLHYEYRSPWSI